MSTFPNFKNLSFTIDSESRVAELCYNRPQSRANLFDKTTLEETLLAAEKLSETDNIAGLIITSAKPSIFIAGADLHSLSELNNTEMEEILILGQNVTQAVSELPFPKVAAINGACVGGGYELALACDWRLAADSNSVKIGLPETQLGIIPGWGGSTRLPKLIGLPKALELILSGSQSNARIALNKGLIDAITPRVHLKQQAIEWLSKGNRPSKSFPLYHNKVVTLAIQIKTKRKLLAKTKGHFPALYVGLDVCCKSVLCNESSSLENERNHFLNLAKSPESRQLIKLFFLKENAKKEKIAEADTEKTPTIETVAVIGAGIMGAGMAYWLTAKGYPTLLKDLTPESLAKGVHSIAQQYKQAVGSHRMTKIEARTKLDLLSTSTEDVFLKKDLIIEAAVEDLEIKKTLFTSLAKQARPDTILATNTSALPISEIAEATPHPERVIGVHFFNPVHRMPLVEIVKTKHTSPETLAATLAFVQRIGKTPIIVKDSPGFFVNRVLVPYLVKATQLFLDGGEAKIIDLAMLEFGMPMGPLRLLDEVGLDVGMHVAQTLEKAYPDRMTAPKVLQDLIREGHLGKKAGKGFYLYQNGKVTSTNPKAKSYQTTQNPLDDRDLIADQLSLILSEETKRCVDEGIVSNAEVADFAMVLGTGYAPFRGGPMKHQQGLKGDL